MVIVKASHHAPVQGLYVECLDCELATTLSITGNIEIFPPNLCIRCGIQVEQVQEFRSQSDTYETCSACEQYHMRMNPIVRKFYLWNLERKLK